MNNAEVGHADNCQNMTCKPAETSTNHKHVVAANPKRNDDGPPGPQRFDRTVAPLYFVVKARTSLNLIKANS